MAATDGDRGSDTTPGCPNQRSLKSVIGYLPSAYIGKLVWHKEIPMATFADELYMRGTRKWFFSSNGKYAYRRKFVLARDDESELLYSSQPSEYSDLLMITLDAADSGALIEAFNFVDGYVVFDRGVGSIVQPLASFHCYTEFTRRRALEELWDAGRREKGVDAGR